MNRLEDFINVKRLRELIGKKEEKREISPVCWVLVACLIVSVSAAVAYALYRYFKPDYLEDFEEDFEDDFDDDDFEDEDSEGEKKKEDSKKETEEK